MNGEEQQALETPAPRREAAAGGASSSGEGDAGRRPHILVVDDHPVNQRLMCAMVGKRGYSVTVAESGAAALACWRAERFDLIFMDVRMPEMSGPEAAIRIREQEQAAGAPRVPIVAVTANSYPEDREECLRSGMDEFLTKPVKEQIIKEVLNRYVGESLFEPAGPPAVEAVSAPAPARPAARLVDHAVALEIAGGDEQLMRELVSIFQRRTPELIGNIEAAIAVHDAETLALHAHTLKGALRMIAVPALEAAARGLERHGRQQKWERVPIWWQELRRGLAELQEELEAAA